MRNKLIKNLLVSSIAAFSTIFIASCDFGVNDILKPDVEEKDDDVENDDYRYTIYQSALKAGYTGTYEEWLASIKGASVSLQVADGYIQMKYSNETTWTNLVALETLKGSNGKSTEMKVTDGFIQWKYVDENDTSWRNLIALSALTGVDGENGKTPEMRVNDEFVQWKYTSDDEWKNLIALSALTGADGENGKSTEMKVTDGFIQWKYVDENDTSWRNLIALSTLTGADGENGKTPEMRVNDEFVQWKYTSDDEWKNLISLSSLVGEKGKDGKTPEIRVEKDTVQWKYESDSEWKNLIELKDISGEDGLSAYEIYLKYHPDYKGTEEDWINDLVFGRLVSSKKATVKFVVDGNEIESRTPYIGSVLEKPEDPSLDGYVFCGWKYDGDYWDFDDRIFDEEMTLVASFVKDTPVPDKDNLDVYINYNGSQGITYQGTVSSWYNSVDGKTYTRGDLLPTWQAFANNVKLGIRDASNYSTSRDADTYTMVSANGFKSDTDARRPIDLFYNTTSNINKMGLSDMAVDLTPYIESGDMPNFKKYLDENQAVREEITIAGKIFYTPYFDSYNDVERNLVMDTSIVQAVLDDINAAFDEGKINGVGGNSNVITNCKYTPFIDANYNYPDATTTVKVSVGGVAKDLTIKQTDNIIKQQNVLLAQGCTGKQLAVQFINYLNAAFGDNVGNGKTYSKLSEIFTEEWAAYNVDELIALMRVVKANPGLITGDASKEVETLFPRGQAANRIQNILHFAQVWGVQGLTSEKDFLYFLQDGTLNDARTSKASYDALDQLAALYSEGLILNDFWYYSDSARDVNAYTNKYFKKSTNDYGFGLMEYDYYGTQCNANDIVDGIGTKSESRKSYTGKIEGIKPVLPPLTMWGIENTVKYNQSLTNFTGKTLMRHIEENRTIKSNAWCIPSTSDNIEGAVRLMDYLFSDMGGYIQDFGPEEYWANANEVKANPSKVTPIMSNAQKQMLADSNSDFWTYMRSYMGSTHGIGHVRSTAIQIQSTNAYGRVGYQAVENAIANGVVDLSLVDKDGDNNSATVTWNTSVPVNNYYGAPAVKTEAANSYDAVASFWAQNKNKVEAVGWVYAVANGGWTALADTTTLGTTMNSYVQYTKADVVSQQKNMNELYLYAYANSLNNYYGVNTFVPQIEEHTYSLDLSLITTNEDNAQLTTEKLGNSFLTVLDSANVSARYKNESNYCIEAKEDCLTVDFQGTGYITISFASTGKTGTNDYGEEYVANVSALGLKDSKGNYLTAYESQAYLIVSGETFDDCTQDDNKQRITVERTWTDAEDGAYYISGTSYVTIKYEITEAGTYTISCPNNTTLRRTRINGIYVEDCF